jgi:hypothetical protein
MQLIAEFIATKNGRIIQVENSGTVGVEVGGFVKQRLKVLEN